MGAGARRQVPPLHRRVDLIRDTHERTGHFGIKRTKHLLLSSFWWPGLEGDVRKVLAACEPCQRVKASFNAERPQLQPLPIMGLFYRWGVDCAGPFPASAGGNTTICIMVEHFSKMIELVAMPSKLAQHTAYAFLSAVLARYGACAQVVTDQGTEFEGEFASLLSDSFIDHCTTSPNHPQADGLAERAVQTIKNALSKHVAQHKQLGDWDWQLHWIALGYRASKQASTGISPYELLFGVPPVIPPAIKERVEDPVLDLSDPEAAAELVLVKAALLRQRAAMAGGNLRIAQHRDILRYEHTRSGTYMPVRCRFAVGDFVYVRRRNVINTLQTEARPTILRVTRILPTGVMQLQGRCGTETKVNAAECAPCHLSGINPALDPSLRQPGAEFPCEFCGSPEDDATMLICDGCLKGYHMSCLQPPLSAVPEQEIWVCPFCLQQGLTAEELASLRQMNMPVAQSDAAVFPSVHQRARDAAAQQLQGRVVWVAVKGQPSGGRVRAVLEYVPRIDRVVHSRSPLRAVAAGQQPLYMSLLSAQKLVEAGPPEGTVALSDGLAAVFVAESGLPVQQQVSCISPGMDRAQAALALRSWSGVQASEQLLDSFQSEVKRLPALPEGQDLGVTAEQGWALMCTVDLRWCAKLTVAGGTAAELLQVYQQRYGSKGFWADRLQPSRVADQLSTSWFKRAHQKVPLDWVFLFPGQGLIEMAVGLAVQQARKGVAVLMHRAALSNVSEVFAAMLQRWEGEQRVVCVSSPDCQLVWLVVFATAQIEQAMVSVRGRVSQSTWVLGSWH
jgi:transposase InsO family protein